MTDTEDPTTPPAPMALPPPEAASTDTAPPESHAAEPQRPATRRFDPLPLLFGLGVIILLVAVVYVWLHPLGGLLAGRAPAPADDPRLVELTRTVRSLDQRLAALEQRPSPDLASLQARLDALEQQARAAPAGGTDTTELGKRIEAVAHQAGQIETSENDLAARVEALGTALNRRLDATETRLGAAEHLAAQAAEPRQAPAAAERALRLARLAVAGVALQAGEPLGEIDGAPPALARFATTRPPTEATLRLGFTAAARAAEAVSAPETAGLSFWQAMLTRLKALVTVRRGDEVILGDSTEAVIARARVALAAGDVPGTVATIAHLEGRPAQAFAAWRADAEALLAARAALASLALRA